MEKIEIWKKEDMRMKLEDIVALAKAGYTAEQIDKFVTYQETQVPPVPQVQQVPPVQPVQPVQTVHQVQTVPPVQLPAPVTVPAPVPAPGLTPTENSYINQPVDMLTRGGSREIKSFDDVYNMMRELSNQIIASNVNASRQPEPEYNPSDELAKIINPYDDKEE